MVADARQVEEPGLVLWKFGSVGNHPVLRCKCGESSVLIEVRHCPLFFCWKIPKRLLPALSSTALGYLKKRFALIYSIWFFSTCLISIPTRLFAEERERLYVPALRIAPVRLRLHVVPPHRLLSLRVCPCALTCHCTCLARNASIDVEDGGKLSFRLVPIIRILHLTTKLPIIHFRHELLLKEIF